MMVSTQNGTEYKFAQYHIFPVFSMKAWNGTTDTVLNSNIDGKISKALDFQN